MKNLLFLALIIGIAQLLGGLLYSSNETWESYPIGITRTIHSTVYQQAKKLQIATPKNYWITHEAYPVLYVLDGNDHFHFASGILRLIGGVDIPEMIIVGLPNRNRLDDATPSKDPKYPRGGGAVKYLEYLKKDVVPYIDNHYRTADFRILAGHSLDGLTAVFAYLQGNTGFHAFIANSPSLWWHDHTMVKNALKAPGFGKRERSHLFISNGDRDSPRLVQGVRILKDIFRQRSDLKRLVNFREYSDSGHGDSSVHGMFDGLKQLFKGYFFLDKGNDIRKLKKHFSQLKLRFDYDVRIPELFVKQIGYRAVMGEKNPKKAIAAFQINVKNYPESADAHDCLGEALEADGQLRAAELSYRTAIRIGTEQKINIQPFRAHLDRLKEKLN